MPTGLTLGLLAVSLAPRVQSNAVLAGSFWAAAAALAVWQAVLYLRLRSQSAGRSFRVIARPQHYLQAAVQLAVFLYWGYFWRPVYDHAWLLVAQLLFAYAFDLLLSWSRREHYTLGFGPFPIIFSTNLFLWFRDDWFYLQFLMLAAGFMGKEFVRWRREGRSTHIFNPSAFSLGLFSLILLATGTTDLTWGQDIASTLTLAPRIYLFLFLIGLVVMYAFSITLVAGSAAIVLFGSSALYSAVTGVPYFIDSEIPSAVFLGLHLLVTDPSTSPRTALGKTLFGMLYGVGVFALYALLGAAGLPTFYDKLLCVPLLNLSVQRIDRLAAVVRARRKPVPGAGGNLGPGRREPGVHGGLGAVLRRDDRGGGDRRTASRRHRALLGAGLRRGPAAGVLAADPARDQLLRRQRRLGVQRARPAPPAGNRGPRRPRTRAGVLLPGLRAAVPGRLRQPAGPGVGRPGRPARAGPSAAAQRGRPQSAGHARAGAPGAGLRARLVVRLPAVARNMLPETTSPASSRPWPLSGRPARRRPGPPRRLVARPATSTTGVDRGFR